MPATTLLSPEAVAPGSLSPMITHDRQVRERDPLFADSLFANILPVVNRPFGLPIAHRLTVLSAWAERLAPNDFEIFRMDLADAQAATRDLGMIAASLRRYGQQPAYVPRLEQALITLSRVTGEVPSDTVFSYGSRNPEGERVRRFTDNPQELEFIHCIASGMELLPLAVDHLIAAAQTSIFDPAYGSHLNAAVKYLAPMVDAIHSSRRGITPEFFSGVLRPFFEAKIVGGTTYSAGGAAQMMVTLVDLLLWASEGADWAYWDYFFDQLTYQPASLRSQLEALADLPSLLGSARRQATRRPLTEVARQSLGGLVDLTDVMLRFRGPHKKVAEANFRLRPSGTAGSGGYSPAFLGYLITRTKDARQVALHLRDR